MKLKILVNPVCKGAYYLDFLSVAQAEFEALFPDVCVEQSKCGVLYFLDVDWPYDELLQLTRLSFVQGVFAQTDSGLICLDVDPQFHLPEGLVVGDKYRGKTSETITQLGINIAIRFGTPKKGRKLRLLDPMAGRGTTLLWAARYGIDSVGVEHNKDVLEHFHRHIKKQCKIHRIKHKVLRGQEGKKQKNGYGAFREVHWPQSTSKLLVGDSAQVSLKPSFNMIVTDLPYGVQFTGTKKRNPLDVIERCAANWVKMLQCGSVVVLIFNALQPKRKDLIDVFTRHGLQPMGFAGTHRMSESIKRELLVFQN